MHNYCHVSKEEDVVDSILGISAATPRTATKTDSKSRGELSRKTKSKKKQPTRRSGTKMNKAQPKTYEVGDAVLPPTTASMECAIATQSLYPLNCNQIYI